MQVTAQANKPQAQFLAMPHKFKAFVAGFGCVAADTKIVTEQGLVRIADLTKPVRVLSWNEKSQKFQLSLSGGSFPKGKANLYRVVTQQGEFVASGHHRVFCATGKYQQVSDLFVGQRLYKISPDLICSTLDALLQFDEDAQHWTQTHVDCLGNYASAARQYGLQLLEAQDSDQEQIPLQDDAHVSSPYCGLSWLQHKGGQAAQKLLHSRLYQYAAQIYKSHSGCQKLSRAFCEAGQTLKLLLGRICGFPQEFQQSVSMFLRRHIVLRQPLVSHSLPCTISKTTILKIEVIESQPYFDMQVLNTNNYVTEDGCIHHNSGKSWVGCQDQCLKYWAAPGVNQGYFAPTFPHIRDIFYPTIDEVSATLGLTVKIRTGDKEVDFYEGRKYRGTTICRSMDRPENIVGFKIGHAMIDEFDILPVEKAQTAWRKIIARMRDNDAQNTIDVTTTPEGFKYTHKMFVETLADRPELASMYGIMHASTYENRANLPVGYIESLEETYPDELISAYLNGQFVNLTAGTVYRNYDRVRNRSTETIIPATDDKPGEPLFIGMDFNVEHMAATVYVQRPNGWHAVAELFDLLDTPTMIQTIKEKWPKHKITIYPDATGENRKSNNASQSDLALLRQAGFVVRTKATNPFVKDRILAVNKAFADFKLWINDRLCPKTASCLEQQAYDKNGEPDKKSGHDHQNDATGYPIAFEMPIIKPNHSIKVGF